MVYNNGFGVKIITDSDQDKLKRKSHNYVALENNTEYKIKLVNDRSTDAMAEVYVEGDSVGTWLLPAKNSIIIDRPANIARKFTFFDETDNRARGAGVVPGEIFNGVVRVVFYPKKEYMAIRPRWTYQSSGTDSGVPRTPPTSPRYTSTSKSALEALPEIPGTRSSFSPGTLNSRLSTQRSPSYQSSSLYQRSPSYQSSRRESFGAGYTQGATVLGGKSSQTFGEVERFKDDEIDWDNKTEITLRLIVKPGDNIYISTAEAPGLKTFYGSRNQRLPKGNMWQQQFVTIKNSEGIPPRIDNYVPAL